MEPIHDLNQDGPDVTGKKIVLEISLEFIDCRVAFHIGKKIVK